MKTNKFLFSTLLAAAAMTANIYAGEEIEDQPTYSEFESALLAATNDRTITEITLTKDESGNPVNTENYYDITHDLKIGGSVTAGVNVAIRTKDGGSLLIEEGLKLEGLNVVANGFATTGENMTINGSLAALSLKQWTSNGAITVGKTGSVKLGYGDGQFDMAYGNGTVTINGTGDKTNAQFKAGYSGTRGDGNTLNLNDTYFVGGAWFKVDGKNGSFNLNNSRLEVSSGNEKSLTITGDGNVFNIKNGSLLQTEWIDLGVGNSVCIENSTLTAKSVFGSGRFVGNGAVNLNADRISQQIFIGGTYDEANNRVYSDVRSTVTLGDVSGNGITISDKEFRVNNADITLNANVTAELGNGTFLYLRKSTLNLNGYDLVINSGKFLSTGLDIVGNGTITIDSAKDQPCWQTFASSIGTGVTLKGTKQFCIYEDLTVYGKLQNEGKAGNGTTHIGFNDDFWTDGAILKISGKDASVSQTGGAGVIIHGADVAHGIESSGVVVEDGGTVDWASAGTVTNNGFIEVGAESSLTANVITGTGDVILAGTINVVESLTAGNLTVVEGAELNIGTAIALFAATVSDESKLSFDTLTIELKDGTVLEEGAELDLSTILSGTGVDDFQAALASADMSKVVLKNSAGETYNVQVDENGSIKIGALTPEPSAFGLLAGLGAIALAVSRRRRSRR